MSTFDLVIYCDGGARGNPGPAASAFAVIKNGNVVYKKSKYLGATTNNIAEYNAVIMALKWLLDRKEKTQSVLFILDSELVTKQLNGQYKIKSSSLVPLAAKAKNLERKISAKIFYRWLPRFKNKIADKLVNEELDRNV